MDNLSQSWFLIKNLKNNMEDQIRRNESGEIRQAVNINLRGNFAPRRTSASEPVRRSPEGAQADKKEKTLVLRMFDRIIGFSIFALFFGLPLYFTGLTQQGIIFEKQMYFYFLLLLGLVVWAAKGVISGEMNIRRTPLDIPVLGFWLAAGAATLFSVDRWHSFWGAYGDPSRGFMGVTACVIAYYFIASNFNLKRLRLALSAVLISGVILLVWTFLAVLGIKFLPDALARYAPLSLIGSVSGLGAVFAALVPVITVAIFKIADSKDLKNIFRYVLLGGLLVSLALDLFLILAIYNYVPWLAFFIGIVIFLIFILSKIVRPSAAWTWLPMVLFVLVMVIRMTGAVELVKVNLPVEVSLNYATSAQIAGSSLKDNFLVGSGPATYGYDFSLHRPQDFNLNAFYNLRFFQGTGILAEAVPTLGAVGAFFLAVLGLAWIGTQFFLLYKGKEKNKIYSLGLFSGAAVLFLAVLTLKADGAILLYAFLLSILALMTSLLESDAEKKFLSLSLKASPKFALALAFVFMVVSAGVAFLFVYFGKVYAADIYAGRASAAIYTQGEGALDYVGKAVTLNNREAKYYAQAGQYYMMLANSEAGKDENSRDINKIKQYLNYSVQASARSKDMNPNDVGTVESLALIYENAGLYVPDSLKLASDNYSRALELEPHNPVYDVKLGQIKISLIAGSSDQAAKKQALSEAKDLFQKAVDEKANYADGYYQLALAQEALDQKDEAIGSVGKAIQINPQNANYLLAAARMYENRNGEGDIKAAEQYYKAITTLNDKDINGHFYLGLFYENQDKKDEAKAQYGKVISLLQEGQNNGDAVNQLEKMIANVDKGVKNTPESLGLIQPENADKQKQEAPETSAQPANESSPTIDEATEGGQ